MSSNGDRYLEIRRRLVNYFDRRGCLAADDLADETLNRAGAQTRRSRAHRQRRTRAVLLRPRAFSFFLEYIRRPGHKDSDLMTRPAPSVSRLALQFSLPATRRPPIVRKILKRLNRCMQKLTAADQQLILEYYQGDKRAKIEKRSALAARFSLTLKRFKRAGVPHTQQARTVCEKKFRFR